MAAYGLYTHIRANRWRSIVLIVSLFLLVYVMVYAGALIADALIYDAPLDWLLRKAWSDTLAAIPFATIGAGVWLLFAYKYHQKLIDLVTHGHDVTRVEEPRLYNLLENLAISRGIPTPKLKIAETDALNAFATGLNEKQYTITVTRGLMQRLDDAELEAVLAHELTHIRNGDVRMMIIAGVIAGVIAFFAELLFRLFFRSGWRISGRSSGGGGRERKGGGAAAAILIAIVIIGTAWFLSVFIRFALSRSREYLADAGAVELTKNPNAMIMALRKIEDRGEIEGATSAVMEMCIDNPRSGFVDLFATHPPIDERCRTLVTLAGGHDPGPLPPPEEPASAEARIADETPESDAFLPERPPIELDAPREAGPWGEVKR